MTQLRIYYAHPMAWYGTQRELEDLTALAAYGTVINPNTERFEGSVQSAKRRGFPVMQVFADYIKDHIDVVCFRRFEDGYIGAGVAREILEAKIWGKHIWEIDRGGALKPHVTQEADMRFATHHILTVEETKRRTVAKEL